MPSSYKYDRYPKKSVSFLEFASEKADRPHTSQVFASDADEFVTKLEAPQGLLSQNRRTVGYLSACSGTDAIMSKNPIRPRARLFR